MRNKKDVSEFQRPVTHRYTIMFIAKHTVLFYYLSFLSMFCGLEISDRSRPSLQFYFFTESPGLCYKWRSRSLCVVELNKEDC